MNICLLKTRTRASHPARMTRMLQSIGNVKTYFGKILRLIEKRNRVEVTGVNFKLAERTWLRMGRLYSHTLKCACISVATVDVLSA